MPRADREEAGVRAPPPDRAASPSAGRPDGLRHARITRWLNAVVAVPEMARRVDGHEEAADRKITTALEEEGVGGVSRPLRTHDNGRYSVRLSTARCSRHVPWSER
ncbi:hypothetical protein GCM10023347_30320 [Streptomyces chumphonensis]